MNALCARQFITHARSAFIGSSYLPFMLPAHPASPNRDALTRSHVLLTHSPRRSIGDLQADESLESLVTRAIEHDLDAFERLYELHHRTVRSLISCESSDRDALDDLVQDVFTLAWRRLPLLREPTRFRPWLLQIARRVVIDHGRKLRRRFGVPTEPDLLDCTALVAPGPEEYAEAADLAERIGRAFAGLSQRDVALLRRSVGNGGSPVDMALVATMTPGAAKVGLHRARARLAEQLQIAG